jgi:hypothetical protein
MTEPNPEIDQTTEIEQTSRNTDGRSWSAGRHPVNVLHLVFGVAFLGMVVNWALIESGTVGTHGLRWLLPIPWVAAGAAGLIAASPRLRGTRD